MSSLIIATILIVLLFGGFLYYIYLQQKSKDKMYKDLINQLVISLKSQNVTEYVNSIPEEGELPQETQPDDLVDLNEVDPDLLAKKMKERI